MSIADILLSILWLALFIYAIFGGADFGAGMLELFAFGESGARQEALIDQCHTQHEQTRQRWIETRSHSQAIDKVVDGYRRQERHEQDRREQQEQDERAQRTGKK